MLIDTVMCIFPVAKHVPYELVTAHVHIYVQFVLRTSIFDQVCSHQGLLFIYQKHHSNYEVTFYIILRLHFINISLQSYI